MCVDDDDSDDDGGDDEDHGEEHVLPNEWYSTGGRGDQLHDDQQEHSQRQQDRDAESHLLTCEKQKNIYLWSISIRQVFPSVEVSFCGLIFEVYQWFL